MAHLFISYVAEDEGLALTVARALRERGYHTWTYQENGLPGVSYLEQVHEAIRGCSAFVLVISPASINAPQVTKEIESAHENGKRFVPLRAGVTHGEFQTRNPIMRMAVGTSVSIEVSQHDAATVAGRIVAALDRLGVERENTASRTQAEKPSPAKALGPKVVATLKGVSSAFRSRIAMVLMLPALFGGLRLVAGIVPEVRRQTGYNRLTGASFWLIALAAVAALGCSILSVERLWTSLRGRGMSQPVRWVVRATATTVVSVILHFAAGGSFSWALPSLIGALCAAIAWRLLEQRPWS